MTITQILEVLKEEGHDIEQTNRVSGTFRMFHNEVREIKQDAAPGYSLADEIRSCRKIEQVNEYGFKVSFQRWERRLRKMTKVIYEAVKNPEGKYIVTLDNYRYLGLANLGKEEKDHLKIEDLRSAFTFEPKKVTVEDLTVEITTVAVSEIHIEIEAKLMAGDIDTTGNPCTFVVTSNSTVDGITPRAKVVNNSKITLSNNPKVREAILVWGKNFQVTAIFRSPNPDESIHYSRKSELFLINEWEEVNYFSNV